MNKKIFETTVRFFTENKPARYVLHFIYNILPLLVFVSYPALLVYAYFLHHPGHLLKLVLVPLCVFVGVTLLRVVINETRPYEKYGIESVFGKKTQGKSMPSRHTASAFIIAMAFLSANVPLGIIMLVFAVLIGASRVLAGAHYIRDVVVAMLISVPFGWIMSIN